MKKLVSIFKSYYEFIFIIIFGGVYVGFCSGFMINLPYCTWFSELGLAQKFLDGTMKISDLFFRYGEHGLFGYNLLFLLNLKLFNINTLFDVYVNDINVILIAVLTLILVRKSLKDRKGIFYPAFSALICLVLLSTVQWSSGGMETQVRLGILFFVIAAIFIDRSIREKVSVRYIIVTALLIILNINVFGTLYTFAPLPLIFILMLIYSIRHKQIKRDYIVIAGTYLFSTIFYIYSYSLFSGGTISNTGIKSNLLQMLQNPFEVIKSIFSFNASGLIGYSAIADGEISPHRFLFVGFIITCVYIYAIFRYCKSKMYRDTTVPLMFMAYTLTQLPMVLIGRVVSWQWVAEGWYVVHTKLGLAACIWIIIYDIQKLRSAKELSALSVKEKTEKKAYKLKCAYFVISILTFIVFTGALVFGSKCDFKRAPNIKVWFENMKPYLYVDNASDMPVDSAGNTPFADNLSHTMWSIGILKEYKLSVFAHPLVNTPQMASLPAARRLIGFYSYEGSRIWMSQSSSAVMYTGDNGNMTLKGDLPDFLLPNKITIYINDQQVYSNSLTSNDVNVQLKTAEKSYVTVKIVMDRSVVPSQIGKGQDQRNLGLRIETLYFK